MTSGKWWSFYGTRDDQDGAALWDVRCACCGEFVTRHDLADLPSKCPRCGEGAMTNYEKLFGTPERAARTLQPDSMSCKYCLLRDFCKDGICLIDDYDELLECLESEVSEC